MTLNGELTLVWLTGASCDGCTVSILGDTSFAPIEDLLAGQVAGLPRLRLIHPLLALEEGIAFTDLLRDAAEGRLGPYGLMVETSLPRSLPGGASFGWIGEENGRPIDLAQWSSRLAPGALFVVAIGDCAVFGGPHSGDQVDPSGAVGVESHLGWRFRSAAGLPVIHLPGCSVPNVVIATLASLIRNVMADGPPLDLDSLGRPASAYS